MNCQHKWLLEYMQKFRFTGAIAVQWPLLILVLIWHWLSYGQYRFTIAHTNLNAMAQYNHQLWRVG